MIFSNMKFIYLDYLLISIKNKFYTDKKYFSIGQMVLYFVSYFKDYYVKTHFLKVLNMLNLKK